MTGSLLYLAANKESIENISLTGNPEMSYFRNVHKKHSNFSKETIKLYFTESEIKMGHKHYCSIPRKGSLLSKLYLYIELPDLISVDNNESWKGYINGVGYSIIKSATLKIGGMEIDKYDSQYFDLYNELYDPNTDSLVGKFNSDITLQENSSKQNLYIPLPFWFTKNSELSLPLEALKYHDIEVIIEFRKITEIVKSNIQNLNLANTTIKSHLIGKFIHLDSDEKRKISKKEIEYVIEQTQILAEADVNTNTSNVRVPLEFKHPVKDIFWVVCDDINHVENIKTGNNWLSYTSISSNYSDTFSSAKISLDGNDLIEYMNADYYRNVVPYEVYGVIPRKYIYAYSFSLNPEDHFQPSGSCNFSQFTRAFLDIIFNTTFTSGGSPNGKIKVYATSYNVFKIKNGMGGLLFAM
tara:strand:+ start:1053 stop:2285 length:1233 start_codon:yes stop_codon:yes gene_type:complete